MHRLLSRIICPSSYRSRIRMWLARIMCPHSEPLHYHHDGCPSCDALPW